MTHERYDSKKLALETRWHAAWGQLNNGRPLRQRDWVQLREARDYAGNIFVHTMSCGRGAPATGVNRRRRTVRGAPFAACVRGNSAAAGHRAEPTLTRLSRLLESKAHIKYCYDNDLIKYDVAGRDRRKCFPPGAPMKCQRCEKPATFHITELTEPKSPQELHLCEDCAKVYLTQGSAPESPASSLAGTLAQQLKVGQTAEELVRLDQRVCPVCSISFYDFRQAGRLGCPHDYVCFEQELEPLILSIHGKTRHVGKTPKRGAKTTDDQTELIRLRREMKDAVEREEYEKASQLRDQIRKIEQNS
jgi:protein arginine kinase activator